MKHTFCRCANVQGNINVYLQDQEFYNIKQFELYAVKIYSKSKTSMKLVYSQPAISLRFAGLGEVKLKGNLPAVPGKPAEAGHLLCSAFPDEKNDFELETFFLLLNNAGLGDGMIQSKCSCFPFLLVQLILRVFVLRVLVNF